MWPENSQDPNALEHYVPLFQWIPSVAVASACNVSKSEGLVRRILTWNFTFVDLIYHLKTSLLNNSKKREENDDTFNALNRTDDYFTQHEHLHD